MDKTDVITSRANARLVHARKVRDGGEAGLIFVEGRRLVEEALRSGLVMNQCLVSNDFRDEKLVVSLMERSKAVTHVSDKIFGTVADTANTQGIVLIAEKPFSGQRSIESNLKSSAIPIVLCLHEVNNPSNLGAIFRTAEAAGAAGIIVSTGSADVYSPKALRSAMGASFRLPVWERAEFEDTISWAQKEGLVPTATVASAEKSYVEANWNIPRLLIFGSESLGLSVTQLNAIPEVVRIPMKTGIDSLNLAVSAGVILFEAKRQIDLK